MKNRLPMSKGEAQVRSPEPVSPSLHLLCSSEDRTRAARCASGGREVLFWLLLLGSWQFLTAGSPRSAVVGVVSTAAFLVFAGKSLGKLHCLGLSHAAWMPTRNVVWFAAALGGLIAGATVSAIVAATDRNLQLSTNWRLVLLQLTLGPILEEILFRGYLFAALQAVLPRNVSQLRIHWPVIAIGAIIFALMHFSNPSGGWLRFACIAATGAVYGYVRAFSESTAPAATAHAMYNLTLYIVGQMHALLVRGT